MCWLKFSIRSDTTDIAVRVLFPGLDPSDDKRCFYQIDTADWKLDEGFAYNSSKQVQFIAKVCGLRSYRLTQV